ncbi:MAG: PPOX class F420-dependent oxidoreductase [Acidimicrobiia bacterium]|nr:PPOX class F420-dependent oxidoreductase [Acidimicrobiia bacterium]
MYYPMSTEQQQVFLRDPVRPAILSTVRADGRPHAAPIWYDLDGDVIVFTTGASTVKGRNLTRDPRVTLCVHDDRPPFSFLVAEGRTEISDEPGEMRAWAAKIGGRYMGEDRAKEYGARNGVPGELLVRVTITHATGALDIAT